MKKLTVVMLLFLVLPMLAHADPTDPLTGNFTYYGTATIIKPAVLGVIDLAFNLNVVSDTVQPDSSYIIIDKTLVFPLRTAGPTQVCRTEPVCRLVKDNPTFCKGKQACLDCKDETTCVDTGPRISQGAAGRQNFSLTVEPFDSPVAQSSVYKGGPGLEPVKATRKITLAASEVLNEGTSISGDYTEEITGLDKATIKVEGKFFLVRPMSSTALSLMPKGGCVGIAEIRAGGSNPNVVEYGDISAALHIYNNPTPTLKICDPADIRDALTEYYLTLK